MTLVEGAGRIDRKMQFAPADPQKAGLIEVSGQIVESIEEKMAIGRKFFAGHPLDVVAAHVGIALKSALMANSCPAKLSLIPGLEQSLAQRSYRRFRNKRVDHRQVVAQKLFDGLLPKGLRGDQNPCLRGSRLAGILWRSSVGVFLEMPHVLILRGKRPVQS